MMRNQRDRFQIEFSRFRRCPLRLALWPGLLALAASVAGAQTPPGRPPTPTPAKQPPAAQPPAAPPAAQPPAAKPPAPAAQPPANPQQPPATPQTGLAGNPEFRKGVLYGRVLDVDGKPVPDATVALQEKDGKVLAWTKTNAQGEYALGADTSTALHLRPSRRRGLLETCARAVGDVVIAPVKVVGNAVANPGQTLKSAAVSVATGTPAPLAGQAIAPLLADKNLPDETAKKARETAVKTAVGDGPHTNAKKPTVEKGEALLLVSAPNFKDAKITAGAYWLEAPSADKDKPLGMQAWLETVKLAPTMGDKKSDVAQEALTLTEPVIEPSLIPAGGTVKIRVKLLSPPGPEHRVRVFAREAKKDTVLELKPQEGADKNIYVGTLNLDPKTPAGETTLTLAALRADPVEVKLDPKKADPLEEFVRRLDDMQAGKPYEYDPRIMASENRLDIKVTVLDAKKGTPTSPPATEVKK